MYSVVNITGSGDEPCITLGVYNRRNGGMNFLTVSLLLHKEPVYPLSGVSKSVVVSVRVPDRVSFMRQLKRHTGVCSPSRRDLESKGMYLTPTPSVWSHEVVCVRRQLTPSTVSVVSRVPLGLRKEEGNLTDLIRTANFVFDIVRDTKSYIHFLDKFC